MDFEHFLQEYKITIGKNIDKYMNQKGLSQKQLSDKCKENGYTISQATISGAKNGTGNLTIANLLAIACALETDISDLLKTSDFSQNTRSNENALLQTSNSEFFITNPDSDFFKCYLGTFNIFFFKTVGITKEIINGTINFSKSYDGTQCNAVLKFNTGELISKDNTPIEKIYEGRLVLSHSMHAAYCLLSNKTAGEICMLVFHQWFSINNPISSIMAAAITTASGSNRLPTVHRMYLTRKEVHEKDMEFIEGQLLMNTSEIYLTDDELNIILSCPELPNSFKEILQKNAQKEKCICIPERSLYDPNLSEDEMYKWISYVRAHSKSPKYNKISKRTEETLYSLVKNNPSIE